MRIQSAAPYKWIVIASAIMNAVTGCQSVTTRGQSDTDLIPFPEAADGKPEAHSLAPELETPSGMPRRDASSTPTPPKVNPATKSSGSHSAGSTATKASPPIAREISAPSPIRGAPSELRKTSLPTYVIEPPDILLIDAVKLVPKPPYLIQALDQLQIVVVGTLIGQDIAGQFVVDPSGTVDLGPAYGKVRVANQSIDEATQAIDQHLRRILRNHKCPSFSVNLAACRKWQVNT